MPHTVAGMITHTLRAVWAAFVAVVLVAVTAAAAPSAHAATAAQQQATYAAEIGQLVDLHNAERVRHGRARVQFVTNPSVQVSQVYNDKLASGDRSLAHNTAAGMQWPGASPFGENLILGSGRYASPTNMMQRWMASPGHRDNVLNPNFRYVAIGFSVSPEGVTYATVNFYGGSPTNLGAVLSSGADVTAALRTTGTSSAGPVNVYTTAGTHTVNGRQWRTACSVYSSAPRLIERCRTDIWATQITYSNGRYSQTNGWVFNNLTYKPAPRSFWGDNPLARTGVFTSSGREWKTSCGDSWTGPKGCRSFIRTSVVESFIDATGNRAYRTVPDQWVFNNVVYFT